MAVRFQRFRSTLSSAATFLHSQIDAADICFFGGILLIGFGIGGRYGAIATGALLVLKARPLWFFLK